MNVTLIGMPGSGKSTVGKLLAKKLGYNFIDTDSLIEEKVGKRLQEIIETEGEEKLLILEQKAVLGLTNTENSIIAPGGSIIFSPEAMRHLKALSRVLYIDTPIDEIRNRIKKDSRGIIGAKNKTLEEIFLERRPLYEKYADLQIAGRQKTPEQIAGEIFEKIKET